MGELEGLAPVGLIELGAFDLGAGGAACTGIP